MGNLDATVNFALGFINVSNKSDKYKIDLD